MGTTSHIGRGSPKILAANSSAMLVLSCSGGGGGGGGGAAAKDRPCYPKLPPS
jgi:hypothetical protein